MPRQKREIIPASRGSMHMISRTAGGETRFTRKEKEYLMNLVKAFAAGFYVRIRSFSIMGNHFHILADSLEEEAQKADFAELLKRYRKIFGKDKNPPRGSYCGNGTVLLDDDGGEARLRRRLGSISCFIKEIKQKFAVWYNSRHERKGCLWGERFKSVMVEKGDYQLVCSAYIDLNALRAGLVKRPEDYRWCSIGTLVRDSGAAAEWLSMLTDECPQNEDFLSWYRGFLYAVGSAGREGKASISREIAREVENFQGKLGIGAVLRYRVRNISEGMAIGSQEFIADIQRRGQRRNIRPRRFIKDLKIYTTRVLHS